DRDKTAEELENARKYGDRTGAALASTRAERDAAYDLAADFNERARALENERDELRKQVATGRADAREAARKLEDLNRQAKDARGGGGGGRGGLGRGRGADRRGGGEKYGAEGARGGAREKELARRNDDLKKAGRDLQVRDKELDTARMYKEKWAASAARVEAL